jgi:hypothetical protein
MNDYVSIIIVVLKAGPSGRQSHVDELVVLRRAVYTG